MVGRLSLWGPSRSVIDFADGVDHDFRLVELDVFRAIVREDLFGVGRELEPTRLSRRILMLVFEVLRSIRRLLVQVADTVVSRGEHADWARTERTAVLLQP